MRRKVNWKKSYNLKFELAFFCEVDHKGKVPCTPVHTQSETRHLVRVLQQSALKRFHVLTDEFFYYVSVWNTFVFGTSQLLAIYSTSKSATMC